MWKTCPPVSQMEEKNMVEQPDPGSKQSKALGMRRGRSWEVVSSERDWRKKRQELKLL